MDGSENIEPGVSRRRELTARTSSTRRVLGGGFLVVLAALLVLLALQYSWLADLEKASAVARHAQLESYLGRIAKDVRFFYVNAAERALNLSATILQPEYVHKIGKIFGKKGIEGASRLFVVSFVDGRASHLLYDPETHDMVAPEGLTPEVQAIAMATAPWVVLAKKGSVVESVSLYTEERDPAHRMILYPITDETSRVAGVAGLIVDQEYFLREVLRKAIEDAVPDTSSADEVVVSVRDGAGRPVWPPEPGMAGEVVVGESVVAESEIRRSFSFLFTDWQIAIAGRTSTPEQWARSNFALNVTLSLALGVVLLGALVLVLRATARAMRLSEMKSHFVSNVSHELRTPLASIRVFGELLRLGRARSPEKVREYGEFIETESRRLTQLINNILDFSRIESGSWTYELEPADLEEIVADVLTTFRVRLRESGFSIDYRGPAAPLPELRLDRDAIRQALFNLLDNAVKYSGDGREILVSLHRRDGRAVVAVEDRGIGVSRPEQKKIFERFHRVGDGLVHNVKGSGLGLAIVRHIVRAHGGEVRLESELGRGSTFSVHLPIEPTEGAESAEPALPSPRGGGLTRQPSG